MDYFCQDHKPESFRQNLTSRVTRKPTFSPVPITVLLITVSFLLIARNFVWTDSDQSGQLYLISSDGKGYYSYLTNIFLEGNFDQQKADGRYFVENSSGVVNMYYPGTAFLMAPFMALGRLAAGEDLNHGYANSFHIAIGFAALFYFAIGLLWYNGLLRRLGFSTFVRVSILVLASFGTNLMSYTVSAPAMSHVYSWFAVAGFLLFFKKFSQDGQRKSLVIASALLGLIVLIRPINGLIIFAIPFLLGSLDQLTRTIALIFKPHFLFPSLAIFVPLVLVQPLLVYIQSGTVGFWTYAGSGFYFLKPAIKEFLFSYRKGLLLYTPLLAVSILSAFLWFRKDRFRTVSFLLFMALLVYIFSAWFNWYYGPSFGQRPFVEFLPVALIPLGTLLSRMEKSKWPALIGALLIGIVLLNLIQSYQYQSGIMSHWNMTKEKYWYIFLRTNQRYEETLGGYDDVLPYNSKLSVVYEVNCTMDNNETDCQIASTVLQGEDMENSVADYSGREFNLLVEVSADKTFLSKRGLYAVVKLDTYYPNLPTDSESFFVIEMKNRAGETYEYKTVKTEEVPVQASKIFKPHEYRIHLPEVRSANDRLKFYVWNPQKLDLNIDNLRIELSRID